MEPGMTVFPHGAIVFGIDLATIGPLWPVKSFREGLSFRFEVASNIRKFWLNV
jgi:hypothetical protein